jgi:hypothetical protein
MALFRHAGAAGRCPLTGVKRKSHFRVLRTAFDPFRKLPLARYLIPMLSYLGLNRPIEGASLDGERVERRLAAVLAADVAGYSRLMGADEEGTWRD